LLVQLERHIARLLMVNFERNEITVREGDTFEEALRLMDERLPSTVIVENQDVKKAIELSFPGATFEFIVLDGHRRPM
jgi:hypothetical protein